MLFPSILFHLRLQNLFDKSDPGDRSFLFHDRLDSCCGTIAACGRLYICKMIIGQGALNTNTLMLIISIMILIILGGGEQWPAWQGLVDHLHGSLPSPCRSCYCTCLWMDTNTNLVDHICQKLCK